jgi:hypothetical protein
MAWKVSTSILMKCLDVQVLIVMSMRMAPLPEEFPGPRYGNDEKWLGEFLHPF